MSQKQTLSDVMAVSAGPLEDTQHTSTRDTQDEAENTEASLKPSAGPLTGSTIFGRFRHRFGSSKRLRLWILGAVVLVVIALGLGLGLGLGLDHDNHDDHDNSGPVIHLGYATYRGTHLANGIDQFLGIRYAQPPLGTLRWRAPVAPEEDKDSAEESVQMAKAFAPICLGISDPPGENKDFRNEDCLFANVWAPANASAAGLKLPVMVFIQGGGYTRNANANWNGTRLVETSGNGIVFVNFNYRVGLWGFLAGEAVRSDGDLNVGLLDQRRLLQWVQDHIHNFGGDPDHVVIQGVSAGAGAAALHLVAYGGRNDHYFAAAISESTFIPAHPPVSELEYQFDRTIEQAGCQDADNPMKCLRDLSDDDIQRLNVPGPFPGRSSNPLFYWTPCIDGQLLEDSPTTLFSDGKFFKVPLLFGTCTNEGTVFARDASSQDEVVSFLLDNYPTLTPSQISKILDLYPQQPELPSHNSWFASASRAYGEATFVCQVNNILNDIESNTTWSYRYDVQQTDTIERGFGVPHVAEIPAVMGPDMLSYTAHSSYTTYNADAVPLVMNYWLSFAKTFDPNPERLPGSLRWDNWARNQTRIVLRSQGSELEAVGNDERDRCRLWKDIGPELNQ